MLSLYTKKYLDALHAAEARRQEEGVDTIHVDALASKVAVLYEKIRSVIDYQEEHLLRKNAIGRILRRRFFVAENLEAFSEPFVRELIERGYFPNDQIPTRKIQEVERVITKYAQAISFWEARDKKVVSWLFDIASCEIEETLAPPHEEEILFSYAQDLLQESIELRSSAIIRSTSEDDKKSAALAVAIYQVLLRTDRARTHWRILKRTHKEWSSGTTGELGEFIPILDKIKKRQEETIDSFLAKRLKKVVKQYAAAFVLIHQGAAKNPREFEVFIQDEEKFEPYFLEMYLSRFHGLQKKIRRASFRSVVSIFAGKTGIALALEVPFDVYILHHFVPQALVFNILFPPLLMFFIITRIQKPSQKDFGKLLLRISALLKSAQPKKVTVRLSPRKQLGSFVYLFYGITFLASFGAIAYGLTLLGFSVLSIAVFIMFLSLISFSALRIKDWTSELTMEEEKEGWGSFFLDLVALPIIKLGKWLSGELQRFNVFILFLNVLFEAPIQSIVSFIADWRSFIREKKEEL